MAVAQTAALAVALLWMAPLIIPYTEGARETRLVELARTRLPRHEIVLYDTWPAGAAFALQRTVPVYEGGPGGRPHRPASQRNRPR